MKVKNNREKWTRFLKDRETQNIVLKTTLFSLLGFLVLTSLIPVSSYTFFNYFLNEVPFDFVLGSITILIFSSVLGLTLGFLKQQYEKFFDKRVLAATASLWLVNFYLTLSKTSYSIYSYTQMNGFLYTNLSLIMGAVTIPMISLLLVNIYKSLKNKSTSISSSGGMLAWLFSVGCPSCGAILYSLLGVSAGLSIFPLKGLELKALSLGLVAFSVSRLNPIRKQKKHSFKAKNKDPKLEKFDTIILASVLVIGALMVFNQLQIQSIASALGQPSIAFMRSNSLANTLEGVDITPLASTAATVASVFPELKNVKSEQDVINLMLPTGTPEYSSALGGVTFDDPITSLSYLSKWYYVINDEVKQNPEEWQRYLKLAAAPRGISCEFCCGVGPQGITADGQSRCGCQHNPALLAVTLGLIHDTNYSDAQILREVMRWKTLFFPKNMVAVGIDVAGKDPAKVNAASLNTMVGGC